MIKCCQQFVSRKCKDLWAEALSPKGNQFSQVCIYIYWDTFRHAPPEVEPHWSAYHFQRWLQEWDRTSSFWAAQEQKRQSDGPILQTPGGLLWFPQTMWRKAGLSSCCIMHQCVSYKQAIGWSLDESCLTVWWHAWGWSCGGHFWLLSQHPAWCRLLSPPQLLEVLQCTKTHGSSSMPIMPSFTLFLAVLSCCLRARRMRAFSCFFSFTCLVQVWNKMTWVHLVCSVAWCSSMLCVCVMYSFRISFQTVLLPCVWSSTITRIDYIILGWSSLGNPRHTGCFSQSASLCSAAWASLIGSETCHIPLFHACLEDLTSA